MTELPLFPDLPQNSPNPSAGSHRPPLAERLRPTTFDAMVGQHRLVGGVLDRLLDKRIGNAAGSSWRSLPSLLLWGPPGCGKTTIARIVATRVGLPPVSISAVVSGVKELKAIIGNAQSSIARGGPPTLLFVDEIHRFNRAQQDSFLGPLEEGSLVLIGATTENPSFRLNAALLSRCQVLTLEPLAADDLATLLERALTDPQGLDSGLTLTAELRQALIDRADGDARALLTDLEWLASSLDSDGHRAPIDVGEAQSVLAKLPRYDRAGEEHFNLISALHKSLRGSDVNAGLYWLARMLKGGEDPLYIARRLVRFATEDIGAADPQALPLAIAATEAVRFIGLPEGALALAELVVYLGSAPKSDRVYRAYRAAVAEVERSGSLPPPLEIRNAPTKLMKDLGYGVGYRSPHESAGERSNPGLRVPFFPDAVEERRFYEPGPIGFERDIARRMEYYERLRRDDGG